MMTACVVAGVLSLAAGAWFYWLNLNTPIQTCIPAALLPIGAALILLAAGAALL